MSAAVRKMEQYVDGVNVSQLELSLDEISNQLRLMDQKLMMKTEQEISNQYENQRYEMSKVKATLEQFK